MPLRLAAALPLVWCAAVAAASQPTFRSGVDVVRVDVAVMNGIHPVTGLTKDNFEILDDGVPQTIESASLDTVPINLTMVLDTSFSMRNGLPSLIEAVRSLAGSLRQDDAASLVTFATRVQLIAPTSFDRGPLLASLKDLVAAGTTSLHDAVFYALQLRPTVAVDARRVLLVFSDGLDTASWLDGDQALESIRRSRTIVHVVELSAFDNGTPYARELARVGGGRVWAARSERALRELFGKVLDELRSRYLLTYSPTFKDAGWHDVKVTIKGARGQVMARPGYFVSGR
jgi:VWFA-related protein